MEVVRFAPCAPGARPTTSKRASARFRWGRWVAEAGGTMAGVGFFLQRPSSYHPRKFHLSVAVLPPFRRRGLGTALCKAVLAELEAADPINLSAEVREDAGNVRFAERLGFVEAGRQWNLRLDLAEADLSAHLPVVEALTRQGYTIRGLTDLAGPEVADTPRLRDILAMFNEVRKDVPGPERRTDLPLEHFLKSARQNPHFWREGFLVAFWHDEPVGVSQLWKGPQRDLIQTGITAVRRGHRGKGVATALKVAGLQLARNAGYRFIETSNATTNQEMLAVNAKLGFVRQAGWVELIRRLRDE